MYTILISGKQGSGKSTLAGLLVQKLRASGVGAVRERFAGPVYEAHDAVLAVLRPLGIFPDVKKDGELLVAIGTTWGRAKDPDLWVKAVKRKLEITEGHFRDQPTVRLAAILEDCRFKNEFDLFPGAFSIRLECPEDVRRPRTNSWRENTSHESETGLDDYVLAGKFDLVAKSDTTPADVIAAEAVTLFKRKFALE